MISACPDIEIAMQYDLVTLQDHSESGTQGVVKTIFHIIGVVYCRCVDTYKGGKAVLASVSRNFTSRSSIAMRDSRLLYKGAVLTAISMP